MLFVGAVFAVDFCGVASKMKSDGDAWWQNGPIRRRFKVQTANPRPLGVVMMAMGLLLIFGTLFGT